MTTTTQMTAMGNVTLVTMVMASGAAPPSVIHLADGTAIRPAADGSIQVDVKHHAALFGAGWSFKNTSGQTSVPSL